MVLCNIILSMSIKASSVPSFEMDEKSNIRKYIHELLLCIYYTTSSSGIMGNNANGFTERTFRVFTRR